ncbi:MAG TPA: hypothetical protein DEA26_00740 [Oceanospirillales bacterium]|nr:hypothetical protein [Oceanospirillaceae bacterium]HBS41175.1 hypothetical protein [Oceanospirillales bacterium]|tara:strand:- start:83 stop:355 length:273 start_codon:yes stop_codon:yes gene_type:complete
MASKPFTGAANVASALEIKPTTNNPHPVDTINIQNTGSGAATVYVKLNGASEFSVLEGDVPAGTLKIIEGLRDLVALKIVGSGAAGVITS